jgi:lipopolysaccharide/colanic/teichoic acid biosynthesis glycosyltransferase
MSDRIRKSIEIVLTVMALIIISPFMPVVVYLFGKL